MKRTGIALIMASAVVMLGVAGCGNESPVSSTLEEGAGAPASKLTISRAPAGGYHPDMVVHCDFTYASTAIAEDWTDEGVRHLRGIDYGLNSVPGSGNLEMEMDGVCNHDIILAPGEGNFWGEDTIAVTWNGLTGTFEGDYTGTREAFTTGYSTHVYQGIDGDLVGWTLKLNGIWDMSANKQGVLRGILEKPNGE